jgi:hypothetical protein
MYFNECIFCKLTAGDELEYDRGEESVTTTDGDFLKPSKVGPELSTPLASDKAPGVNYQIKFVQCLLYSLIKHLHF